MGGTRHGQRTGSRSTELDAGQVDVGGSAGYLAKIQSLEEEGGEDLHAPNLDESLRPIAWRPVNRRLVLPLLLLTVAALAGTQAQRTDRQAAGDGPGFAPVPARVATPLFSVRRVPQFLQAPTAERNLQTALAGPAALLPPSTCVEVSEHGRSLFSVDPDLPMTPASAQKLLTGIAALRHLGPDAVLTTTVLAELAPLDGVVDGDVWLVGGGDPLLMTAAYADRYEDSRAYTDLDDLARALVDAGVREVAGGVVGDESRYDAVRYLGTWPDRFKPGWSIQSGPLSALNVDDGFVLWDPVNTAASLSLPADDPAANAARLFDDLLESHGVVVRRRPDSGRAPDGVGMVTLATVHSPTVRSVVEQMLVESDNTTAELLLKEIGRTPSERGTTVGGLSVLLSALEKAGHRVDEVVPHDGSGLDPDNRVTCSLLVDLLGDEAFGGVLADSLPVAGQQGTMKKRFVGTAGEGRVRAKTGTLRAVSSLAGVVDTPAGRHLAFAVITNGELPFEIKELHEDLVLALLSYPEAPTVEVLRPHPVMD